MSEKQKKLRSKEIRFLELCVETGDFADAYLRSGFKAESREIALVKAQRLLARIDAAADYREIFRQLVPSPYLAAHMSHMAFRARDPNLRHRGQKLIADCLGWTEKKEQPPGGGFEINILSAGPSTVQVKAEDSIKQIEGTQEKPQKVEPGNPISLLK